MAQQSNDLRERLLATLPQPENLAAYREETAALLAKHARALRWDKFTANTFFFLAVALFFFSTPLTLGALARFPFLGFQVGSAVFFFMGVIYNGALRESMTAKSPLSRKSSKFNFRFSNFRRRCEKINSIAR